MRLFLAAAAFLLAPPVRAEAPTPVILISIDDLRADRIRPDLTPNLSAIAGRSTVFESAFSQTTWTLPSHASLLLSEYVGTHGAGASNMLSLRGVPPGNLNISQALAAHGYAAASFAAVRFFDPQYGLVEGFSPRTVAPEYADPLPDAAEWIVARATAAAFVFAHTYAVHDYRDAQDPARNPDGTWRCPPLLDRSFSHDNSLVSQEPTCAQLMQDYDRAAHCLDLQIGAFEARLKAAGVWDRAVIAIVSDHGESLCDGAAPGGRWRHAIPPYEEQIHVPWILKLPRDRFAGRRVDAPVELVDVAPTLLSALGLPAERSFQGRDRMPEASGKPGRLDAPVFAETETTYAVRADGWKLIRYNDGKAELFDLRGDPAESRNLAATEPAQVSRLDALLRAHVGRQRGGWRVAARGARGVQTTLTLASDYPLTVVRTAFAEDGDYVLVSDDRLSATARFYSNADGDEDWLIFDVSTPAARVLLQAQSDGKPALVRFGREKPRSDEEWTLSGDDARRRAASPETPPPFDGVSVWRVPSAISTGPAGRENSATRQALRAAGYLP